MRIRVEAYKIKNISIKLTFPKQFKRLAPDRGKDLLYFLPQIAKVCRGTFVDGKASNFLLVCVRVDIGLH